VKADQDTGGGVCAQIKLLQLQSQLRNERLTTSVWDVYSLGGDAPVACTNFFIVFFSQIRYNICPEKYISDGQLCWLLLFCCAPLDESPPFTMIICFTKLSIHHNRYALVHDS
jgi:hypothetical protein